MKKAFALALLFGMSAINADPVWSPPGVRKGNLAYKYNNAINYKYDQKKALSNKDKEYYYRPINAETFISRDKNGGLA
jgi:hypothetical protein